MNDKIMKNLQAYITKRSLGQSDADVIEYIEKIESREDISQEEWEKLAYPLCANADSAILKYILRKTANISIAKELIVHTLRFRHKSEERQLNQAEIVKTLLSYIDNAEKENVLNEALVYAAWFGEYEALKLLIEEGARFDYVSANGKSVLELSQNAVEKFGDSRGYDYILSKLG